MVEYRLKPYYNAQERNLEVLVFLDDNLARVMISDEVHILKLR